MTATTTTKQLDELQLLQCSLLPGELLTFLDDAHMWNLLLDAHPSTDHFEAPSAPCRFALKISTARMWFELELPALYPDDSEPLISVKGEDVTRSEQERWQAHVREKSDELKAEGTEYPVYQLMSLHLLPLLHAECESAAPPSIPPSPSTSRTMTSDDADVPFHCLFTSHHLIAPSKRRALQAWTSELHLAGLAKLGHPGVIYACGARAGVEDFVARVKGLQWLALRVRFVEPDPYSAPEHGTGEAKGLERLEGWREFTKVGEVVAEMRRVGREECVVEMGIGSAGR